MNRSRFININMFMFMFTIVVYVSVCLFAISICLHTLDLYLPITNMNRGFLWLFMAFAIPLVNDLHLQTNLSFFYSTLILVFNIVRFPLRPYLVITHNGLKVRSLFTLLLINS
jgi:hypothetical protein